MDEIQQRPPTEISRAARAPNTVTPIFAGRRLLRAVSPFDGPAVLLGRGIFN